MKRVIFFGIICVLFASVGLAQGTPGTVRYPNQLDTTTSLFDLKNNASTALAIGVNNSATTITVTSTSGFPSTGSFTLNGAEIVYYTSKTSTTFTGCLRGQDGTSATSHIAGVTVRQNFIARHITALRDAIIAIQTKLRPDTDSTLTIGGAVSIGVINFDLRVSSATNKPTLRYNASAAKWQFSNDGTTFSDLGGSGITSLGGLSAGTQTFALAFAQDGVDPHFTSASGVHTLNIPDAGNGQPRGLITNENQQLYGRKQFVYDNLGTNPAVRVAGADNSQGAFSVVNGDRWRVDYNGDIVRIKSVGYSWPTAQATSAIDVLGNNGSGVLSWSPPKIKLQSEGADVNSGIGIINFTGAGVTATLDGTRINVDIPGGGGASFAPGTSGKLVGYTGSSAVGPLDAGNKLAVASGALNVKGVREGMNIKLDYGAVGNGSTNDLAALQAAITAANPGDTVYIPPGNYKINSTWTINKRVNLIGDGSRSAFTCNVGTLVDCIVVDGATGAGTYTDNVIYQDFMVLGGASAARNGIVFRNVTHANVRNVRVATGTSSTGYGMVLEGVLVSTFEVKVSAAMNYPYTATAPENGILVKGGAAQPSNANLFLYPTVALSNTSGESFFIDGSTGTAGTFNNWIVGGNIEGGGLNGLHIKNAGYWSVSNIHLENTSGSGDYNRVRMYIENASLGQIGPGVGATGIFLINSNDIKLDGIVADYVSLDSSSKRNKIGNIQYNVSGLGSIADAGVDTIYSGDLTVPGVTNGMKTGPGSTDGGPNLVRNGGAENWVSTTLTDWSTTGTLTKTGTGLGDTRKLYGDYAVKTTTGTSYVFIAMPEPDLSSILGKTITATAWVYIPASQTPSPIVGMELWIDGGSSAYGGPTTTTTGQWVKLSAVYNVPSAATTVQITLHNSAASSGGYFYADGVTAQFGRTGAHSDIARVPDSLSIGLRNGGNYRSTLAIPSGQTSNYDFHLPNGYGTNGQAVITDGAGNWAYSDILIGTGLWIATSGSGARTIDWTASASAATRQHTMTGGNVTFTFSNPTQGRVYNLILIQDATGGRTVTWPASVKWAGGSAAPPDTGSNAKTVYQFIYDGSNYLNIGYAAGVS